MAAEGVRQKKVAATKIVGKANPKNERRFCQEEEERQKRKRGGFRKREIDEFF